MGTHSPFGEKSHTAAHTAKHGYSLLRTQRGFALPAKTLLFHRAFIYIHFPVLCEPHYISRGKNSGKVTAINFIHQPFLIPLFNFSHKRPSFAFTGKSGYTLGSLRKIAHKGTHGETGGVSDMGGITTLGAFRTFANLPGPGIRTAYFAAFGSWSGVLPKNAESLGTAMRLCASLFRGVAAPPGCAALFFNRYHGCSLG